MKDTYLSSNREYFDNLYDKPSAFWFRLNGFFSFNQKSKSKVNMRTLTEACQMACVSFPPGKVLDYGCGFGTFLFEMPKAVEISGVDISPRAIDHCRRIAANMKRNSRFVVADGTSRLPWEDAYFNVVISSHTLEHVENEGALLQELIRCLCNGGILLINVPINETTRDEKHVREYSQKRLMTLFQDNQLSPVLFHECDRLTGFLAAMEGKIHSPVKRVLARSIRAALAPLPEWVWKFTERFIKEYPLQQLVGVARKP